MAPGEDDDRDRSADAEELRSALLEHTAKTHSKSKTQESESARSSISPLDGVDAFKQLHFHEDKLPPWVSGGNYRVRIDFLLKPDEDKHGSGVNSDYLDGTDPSDVFGNRKSATAPGHFQAYPQRSRWHWLEFTVPKGENIFEDKRLEFTVTDLRVSDVATFRGLCPGQAVSSAPLASSHYTERCPGTGETFMFPRKAKFCKACFHGCVKKTDAGLSGTYDDDQFKGTLSPETSDGSAFQKCHPTDSCWGIVDMSDTNRACGCSRHSSDDSSLSTGGVFYGGWSRKEVVSDCLNRGGNCGTPSEHIADLSGGQCRDVGGGGWLGPQTADELARMGDMTQADDATPAEKLRVLMGSTGMIIRIRTEEQWREFTTVT